jgi:hypothetical protein
LRGFYLFSPLIHQRVRLNPKADAERFVIKNAKHTIFLISGKWSCGSKSLCGFTIIAFSVFIASNGYSYFEANIQAY